MLFTILLAAGSDTSILGRQVSNSPDSFQESVRMPDTDKKLFIQKRLLQSYQTDDPAARVQLLGEILQVDPTNAIAREDLAKAETELGQQLVESRNAQTKRRAMQTATAALASGDSARLEGALTQVENAMQSHPDDAEYRPIRDRLQAGIAERKKRIQTEATIRMGHDAYFQQDSRQLLPALRAIEEALRLDPGNEDLESWRRQIELRRSTERVTRTIETVFVALGIALILAVGLFFFLRKPRGRLEFSVDEESRAFHLNKDVVRIGATDDGNDLVLNDDKGTISQHHCEISRRGKRYFLKDMSTNGTWINDDELEAGVLQELHDGDRVLLAGEYPLTFRLQP